MADCIFCKIIKKEIPAEILYEDKEFISFLDIAPINPGHALVVAKKHYENLLTTPDITACQMLSVVKKVAESVLKATQADAFNVGINNGSAAGQIVMHTHYHIIPRFSNDGLKYWPHKPYQEGQMKTVADRIRKEIL